MDHHFIKKPLMFSKVTNLVFVYFIFIKIVLPSKKLVKYLSRVLKVELKNQQNIVISLFSCHIIV
jgi:hypothetical protein